MENPETGAVQGNNVQTGQPAQENPNLDQPAQPSLESLYQLSAQDREAIMALPPEVRNPAVAALNQARADQERGFQDRLERGRQAEENYNTIARSEEFQQFLYTRYQQPPQENVPQGARPSNVPQTGGVPAEYSGEQARVMEDIANRTADILGEKFNLGGVNDSLQSLQRGFVTNQREKDWGTLETWAKDNNYPDPNNQRSNIELLMNRNVGLTLDQAYQATLNLETLPTRQPVSQPNQPVQPTVPPASNELPGQNRSSVVPRTETTAKTYEETLKEAFDRRKEGTDVDANQAFKDAMVEATANYNAANGTTLTVDDLSLS